MSNENMQFPIPNAILEPYIKQAVSAAIIGSLGDGTKLIELAVQSALNTKVDANGNVNNSSYSNTYIFADVVAKNKIQQIAREVINGMAEEMRPKIKEQIERQLKTKHSLIAKTLVDGMIESLSSTWSVSINMAKE